MALSISFQTSTMADAIEEINASLSAVGLHAIAEEDMIDESDPINDPDDLEEYIFVFKYEPDPEDLIPDVIERLNRTGLDINTD